MNATTPSEPDKRPPDPKVPARKADAQTAQWTGFDYAAAHGNLRGLLHQLGRHEFRAYGFARQLRQYRRAMQADARSN